jgi:hypothetical protein
VRLGQYLRLWLGQAVGRAFGRTRLIWFIAGILIGLAIFAIPGLPDISRVASWAVPLVVFLVLLVPELVSAPYRLQLEALKELDEALARIQVLEQDVDDLSEQSRPVLIPVETSPGVDPVITNERDAEEKVFALVVENHGSGLALDGVFQVVRKGIPGYQTPPLMVQFGQTRIGLVPPGGKIRPKLIGDQEWFGFVGASSGAVEDELTLEYHNTDDRWYQTIVGRQNGRWSVYQHKHIPQPSSREIDQAELEARSNIGL